MNTFAHVPPGFRFHPTDEELVDYYLRKKIAYRRIDLDVIKDVDLYNIEPWDLQELCRLGTEEQNEWYFFSHKDKKYPTGTRTNRATSAGFWKATGRDKAIYSKHELVGMRKTLVFYKGRAPNGQKSDWIMHEYRLETDENAATQEEGWVVCRVFKKRIATTIRRMISEHESPIWYEDQVSFLPDQIDSSPKQPSSNMTTTYQYPYNTCKKELHDFQHYYQIPSDHFLQLPLLEGPTPNITMTRSINSMPTSYGHNKNNQAKHLQSAHQITTNDHQAAVSDHLLTDWRVLDKFVASQLSHEVVSKQNHDHSNDAVFHDSDDQSNILLAGDLNKQEMEPDQNASTSYTSSCQIDLWK